MNTSDKRHLKWRAFAFVTIMLALVTGTGCPGSSKRIACKALDEFISEATQKMDLDELQQWAEGMMATNKIGATVKPVPASIKELSGQPPYASVQGISIEERRIEIQWRDKSAPGGKGILIGTPESDFSGIQRKCIREVQPGIAFCIY